MWQGTGSTDKWNLSCYSPRAQAVLFGFSLICSRGGGWSITTAVTLDTVADESRKMADGVARPPSRLCSRDGKIYCYGDALKTIFLLACSCALLLLFLILFFLASYFSLFFSFFSCFVPSSRYVYLLRVPSSVQQPFATLSKYVFYITCSFCLCHLYPTPSRNSFVFYSFSIFCRSFYFSGGVFSFLLCFRTGYAST